MAHGEVPFSTSRDDEDSIAIPRLRPQESTDVDVYIGECHENIANDNNADMDEDENGKYFEIEVASYMSNHAGKGKGKYIVSEGTGVR